MGWYEEQKAADARLADAKSRELEAQAKVEQTLLAGADAKLVLLREEHDAQVSLLREEHAHAHAMLRSQLRARVWVTGIVAASIVAVVRQLVLLGGG